MILFYRKPGQSAIKIAESAIIPQDFKLPTQIWWDSEFEQKDDMDVVVGASIIDSMPDYCVVHHKEDMGDDFCLLTAHLNALGISAEIGELFPEQELMMDELSEISGSLINIETATTEALKQAKKEFNHHLKVGSFDGFLEKYNLAKKDLYFDEGGVSVKDKELNCIQISHFADADIFKSWGINNQEYLLSLPLVKRRTIKVSGKTKKGFESKERFIKINNDFYKYNQLFDDTINRMPPRSKGLNAQCEAFGVQQRKIDIITDENAKLIDDSVDVKLLSKQQKTELIMGNIKKLYQINPYQIAKYCAVDVFACMDLYNRQQELWDETHRDLGIEPQKLESTMGSNCDKLLISLLKRDLEPADEKEFGKFLKRGNGQALQDNPFNDFGNQLHAVPGGLIFSRCAEYPVINGIHSDCDLNSCYASMLSKMNVYVGGESVQITWRYKKNRIKLRDALELVKAHNCPRDGWVIRIDGTFDKPFNTLIGSDLSFNPKIKTTIPSEKDINRSRKSVEKFNALNTSKPTSHSSLLSQEIVAGYVTSNIIDVINLCPAWMRDTYLDSEVMSIVMYPGCLIADSWEEYEDLRNQYPEEYFEQRINSSNLARRDQQYIKNNVVYRFKLSESMEQLKSLRKKLKKEKNPRESILKLVINASYGIMCSIYLKSFNPVGATYITTGARSAAWLMTNGLNGFAPITDGTSFNWLSVPVGLKFKELISNNLGYLTGYDPTIINPNKDYSAEWFEGDGFKQHLIDFYEIENPENNFLISTFSYELKTEVFQNVTTHLFTSYQNKNCGDYAKGFDSEEINKGVVNGYKASISNDYSPCGREIIPFVKVRSYNGHNQELIDWYIDSLKKYSSPKVFVDNHLVGFSESLNLAKKWAASYPYVVIPLAFQTRQLKMMKMISPSQFISKTKKQLENLELHRQKLGKISKQLLDRQFWNNLTDADLVEYGVRLQYSIADYVDYANYHPVGLGFEILAFNRSHKGSLESVRRLIKSTIEDGVDNFNAKLNLDRSVQDLGKLHWLKYLFASIIIEKFHAVKELESIAIKSVGRPTLLTISKENIKTLEEILNASIGDEDDYDGGD